MKTVRTMLTSSDPYPHEHSQHAILAVLIASVFLISTDNMHTLVHKLEDNIKWWSIYACLLLFFYFFSSPFLGKTIQPSYTNFSRWYVGWLLIASLHHLPSFQSMGVDIRMNLSLWLTLFVASILALVAFHVTFLGCWYVGLAAKMAGKKPEMLTILQNSAVLSLACCVFYSHCGNRAPFKAATGFRWFREFLFEQLPKWNATAMYQGWPPMHELKEQVCTNWLGPVGSASDYPVFSKWALYGERVCTDSCIGPSDNISPVYSLWATFIGLYVANFIVERSTGWALTHPDFDQKAEMQEPMTSPNFLDMVPWYSGTSVDLFKTAFDLLVSVTLFLGRFDMRTMQVAMTQAQQTGKSDAFSHTHFSDREEFWFDFMADTGDGGNSTYSIARLLAQPSLRSKNKLKEYKDLPRGTLLVIGGDLAYPNPSQFSYEQRLFRPFELAMQPPSWYKPEHIAVKKPELPSNVKSIKDYNGPQCFAIPGNHDWFDGLDTFMRYICHKSWLGGWLLPQEKSYFAVQLPHGWWVFGLDQALHGDIDIFQFKYFSDVIHDKVGEHDSVILVTHEPNWLLDWYWECSTGKNVAHLIQDHLKGRCRLRLAGDLHHYMRHSAIPSGATVNVQHLVVNGSGGAFLHPTHVFKDFSRFQGAHYQRMAAYPSLKVSQKIALGNILKFRKKNWRFDVFGGIIYFILVFSMLPQCHFDSLLKQDSIGGHFYEFCLMVGRTTLLVIEHSYISAAGAIGLAIFAVLFVPSKVFKKWRVAIGLLHAAAHLSAALMLMLILELGIETCVRHKLLGSTDFHTLYEWYRSKENEQFPDPTNLRSRIEYWTLGLYPACIKYLMAAFDVPQLMAVTRSKICKCGMQSLPRGIILLYYISVFLYYWVFSTPVVSLVFGSYLYICINWFHLHFDEAFSSLRIANYKSFSRCHIKSDGDLEVYTLGIDKVPKEWALDPQWEAESRSEPEQAMSHLRKHPSQWSPAVTVRDKQYKVRIIDSFLIQKLRPL